MRHLTVYPQDLTPEAWQSEQLTSGLGRLPDAVEPRLHLAINGDRSLTFRYPLNGRGYDLLQEMRLICAEGQLYRIYKIKKSDKMAGREVQVTALHIMYDIRRNEITNIETAETDPDGITQGAALEQILSGTPFTVGTVDNTEMLDYLDVLQKSSFWALKEQILALWGGELDPDNWTINIRAQVGLDRRYPIRSGRNLAGIEYAESIEDTITRLHVSGYGGATFESINDGKDYIDSPNINHYPMPLEGRVEFSDDDLPDDLMRFALEHLPTVDVPQVEYDIDLLALRNSVQYSLYKPLETFDLGDTAVIHHDFFDVDITARAMEIERDPVLEENIKIVLGNYKKDLIAALSGASKAASTIDKITTPGGGLRGERIEGAIDLLRARLQASGSYQNVQVLTNQGILLENTNPDSPDYGAIYHGPGILALANSRASDGSWSWKIGMTPNGIAGETILLDSIDGVKISVEEAIRQGASDVLLAPLHEVISTQSTNFTLLKNSIEQKVSQSTYANDMAGKADASAVNGMESSFNQSISDFKYRITETENGVEKIKASVDIAGDGVTIQQPSKTGATMNLAAGAMTISVPGREALIISAEDPDSSYMPSLRVGRFVRGKLVTTISGTGMNYRIVDQYVG